MSSEITSSVSALPGNRTAVSPNIEVICSRVKKRVDCLSSEMSDAIRLRDDGMRRGKPQMDMTWLNKLKAREGETVDLQNKFNETCRGGGKNIFKAFRKLNKKVIACLKAVVALKKEANHKIVAHRVADLPLFDGSLLHNGDGISRSFETVLRHLEKDKPISFSPSQLRTYTKDFSTRLGSGGFGVVYKGQFPNGVNFAVKVLHLKLEDNVASKQFLAEVGTMCRTYHQNLLRLYGYCSDKNMKALVYEYMANGSLYDVLFSNHLNLEWKQIYSIVTDTAKGLSYLHDNCQKRIIHLDIKPANVLIDSNLCPKVADFGLARQYNRDLSHLTLTGFKGTPGYAAPELWSYSPLPGTCKCDVYSYGMLLFKVLQRRKDWNIRQGEDQKLFPVEVLEQYKKGQLEKILRDCGIEEKDRENATKLVLVAFCCIQKNPQNRPSMSTVVKTLEGEIQAKMPSNLVLPQVFTSSGVASTALAEENMLFSTFSSSSITSDGDATTEESILLESRVSSETFPAFAEPIPGERQYPVQKPMVEINKKNQEKKDIIKPEVKKDEVTTVVLKVNMHCEDCALQIKKTLKKMEGVLSADADIGSSLVTVKCNIEPKKLVDRIREKYKKHAVIMETEVGKKKQEKKSVEQDRKWEGKKEEGLGFAKTKSKMKIEKQLDTVKTKSEAKGVIEEEQCIGEPELLKEGQVSIKKEERRTKSKKKKEENLGTMETKSERKDVAEMKLKKEEEEIVIVKLEQVEKEEKEIAKAKAEEKTKGKEKIEEEKDTWEKKIKKEEEEDNTEKNRGLEKKMPTWAMARPKEEFSNWREEMLNPYNLQNFSDENSYTCSIC